MDVKNLLISTLADEYDYKIILQGSLTENDRYPDSFFTYFNNDSSSADFFDNEETVTIWDFDLNFYSVNPTLVNTVLLGAKAKLKEAGFIVEGKGYDVLSDEPSHTGRGINVMYMEREVENNA